jgi:hypothetical protein
LDPLVSDRAEQEESTIGCTGASRKVVMSMRWRLLSSKSLSNSVVGELVEHLGHDLASRVVARERHRAHDPVRTCLRVAVEVSVECRIDLDEGTRRR